MLAPASIQIARAPVSVGYTRVHSALTLGVLVGVLVSLPACQRSPSRRTESTITRHGQDVVISAPMTEVGDSTTGDVMLTGRDLRFSGAAGGDYLGAGGRQIIRGRVHGALRAAGGTVRLVGTVDRNATVAAGNVEVDRLGVIGRNGYLAGRTVHIDGTVQGALLVSAGTVVLNGPVGGDVDVTAGELFVGPGAAITGNLRYRVPSGQVHIDPYSQVTGTVTGLTPETGRGGGAAYFFWTLWMLGFLVVGAVLITFTPGLLSDAADLVRARPGRSALVGLGGILLIPAAIIVAACTVIGLPLAFLTTLMYLILLYVGRIAAAVWLGRWALGSRARLGRTGTFINFGVGGLVLILLRMIPVVGILTACAATVIGVGALLLRMRVVHELSATQLT